MMVISLKMEILYFQDLILKYSSPKPVLIRNPGMKFHKKEIPMDKLLIIGFEDLHTLCFISNIYKLQFLGLI